MFRHRLAPEADYYRLPNPPVPTFHPGSFALCSITIIPGCTIGQWAGAQQVYVLALEHAMNQARPSLADRELFALWN